MVLTEVYGGQRSNLAFVLATGIINDYVNGKMYLIFTLGAAAAMEDYVSYIVTSESS